MDEIMQMMNKIKAGAAKMDKIRNHLIQQVTSQTNWTPIPSEPGSFVQQFKHPSGQKTLSVSCPMDSLSFEVWVLDSDKDPIRCGEEFDRVMKAVMVWTKE